MANFDNFDDLLDNRPSEEPQGQEQQPFSKEEYAAKKQAEREELYARLDDTAMNVAADPDAFRHYLDLQSRLGRYSAVNALLVFSKNPEATQLGDLNHWRRQKVFIRKEELKNPIQILEPGDQYRREDGSVGTFYNIKSVYDISQAERKILPPEPFRHTERQILQALISKYSEKITGVDTLPDDFAAMTDVDGSILVRKGMDFSDTFRAVAYEMACAELADSPELSSKTEFCAYSATYLLCNKYGVETQAFHFDAAGGVFEGMDAQDVKHELSQIRDAADAISGRMARHLDAVSKSAKNRDEAR
jgi:hypothetical protein